MTSLTLARATTANRISITDLGQEGNIDLTADQRRIRQAVADLRAQLTALVEDGAEPYPPCVLAVYVFPGPSTRR